MKAYPHFGCWESRILQVAKAHMLYHGNDYSGVASGSDCTTTLEDAPLVWTSSLVLINLPPSVSGRNTILNSEKKSSPQKHPMQANSGAVFQ